MIIKKRINYCPLLNSTRGSHRPKDTDKHQLSFRATLYTIEDCDSQNRIES